MQSWIRQINQNNILTTGVPAQSLANGAIIERGSNANGEYVKFADGTMICNILNLTGTLTAYTVTVWSFPALFVVRPVVLLSWVVVDGLNERICSTQGGSASSVSVLADVTPTTIGYVSCQAIGRWF